MNPLRRFVIRLVVMVFAAVSICSYGFAQNPPPPEMVWGNVNSEDATPSPIIRQPDMRTATANSAVNGCMNKACVSECPPPAGISDVSGWNPYDSGPFVSDWNPSGSGPLGRGGWNPSGSGPLGRGGWNPSGSGPLGRGGWNPSGSGPLGRGGWNPSGSGPLGRGGWNPSGSGPLGCGSGSCGSGGRSGGAGIPANQSPFYFSTITGGANGRPLRQGTINGMSMIEGFGLDYMHWADDIVPRIRGDIGVRRFHRPRFSACGSSFGPMVMSNWDLRLYFHLYYGGDTSVGYTQIYVRDPIAQTPYRLNHISYGTYNEGGHNLLAADKGKFVPQTAGTIKEAWVGPELPDSNTVWDYNPQASSINSSNFFLAHEDVRTATMTGWDGVVYEFELMKIPDQTAWEQVLDQQWLYMNGLPGYSQAAYYGSEIYNYVIQGRLTKITIPGNRSYTISYKSWTPMEIYDSWERVWQIDTITSETGQTLTYTYGAQTVAGQWAVSNIANSNGKSASYTYTNDYLSQVTRSDGTTSSFTNGFDSVANAASIEFDDPAAENGHRKKTILLSSSSAGTSGFYFAGSMNLIRSVVNAAGEVAYASIPVMNYSAPSGQGLSVFNYVGGGRMMRNVPAGGANLNATGAFWRWSSYMEGGWQMSVNNGAMEFTGDAESPIAVHESTGLWGTLGNLYPTTVDERGLTQTHEYDNGWLVRTNYSDGSFETWCRDGSGRVTRYRDRNGNVTKYAYHSSGALSLKEVGLTDHPSNVDVPPTQYGSGTPYDYCATNDVQTADHAVYQWTYNADGQLLASIDPLTNQTDYNYDAQDQLIEIKAPQVTGESGRATTTMTYHPSGKLKTMTDPVGTVIEYFYDGQDRLISTLYDDGTTDRTEYETGTNGFGLPAKTIDRLGVVTTYEYDAADRLIKKVAAAAQMDGATETPTPELASTSEWKYLEGTNDPIATRVDGRVTTYKYDYRGRRIETKVYSSAGVSKVVQKSKYINNQLFRSEDAFGRKTYYGYDANDGRLIRTVVGTVPEFEIPEEDPSVSNYDPNDAVLALTRDSQPNATYIITDSIYDESGKLVESIDPRNIATKYEYDDAGRQTAVIAAATTGVETRRETVYNIAGQVTEVRSPRYFDSSDTEGYQKASETWTYDERGRQSTHTVAPNSAIAATESFKYDLLGRQIEKTDFAGKLWKAHFEDCCGKVTGSENPLGHGAISRRDSLGRVIHQASLETYSDHVAALDNPVDAKTLREVTTRYDGRGRPVARTTWLVARGVVDATNPPIAGLDGVAATDGITQQYLYDEDLTDGVGLDSATGASVDQLGGGTYNVSLSAALAKLADTEANGGAGITFNADAIGSARVSINAEEEISFSISDAAGKSVMSGIIEPHDGANPNSLLSWNVTPDQATTNLAGYGTVVVSKSVNAFGKSNTQHSDAAGRTIQSIDALGKITSYTYDASGNLLSVRDPNNVGQDCTYDALGRGLTCTDTGGASTSSTYDDAGNKIVSTDAASNNTTYTFDARGRQIKQTDRLGGETEFDYTATGQLASLTDAEDQVTSYTYDDAGGKLTETYPDHIGGTPGQAGYGIVTFTLDATGRTLRKQDQLGDTVTYNYDLAGRLTSRDYRTVANSPSGTIADSDTFTYDAAGRMLTAASGRYTNTVTYTYDDAGRKATEALTIAGVTYTTTTAYNAAGQVTGYTYPDGTSVTRTYTDRGQLATIGVDSTTVDTRTYDDGGRMLTSVYNNGVTETRAYNSDNTLASIMHAGAAIGNYTYGWDSNKNKTSEAITGTMSGYGFTVGASGYDDEDRLVNWERDDSNLDQSWNLSLVGDWNSITENGSVQSRTHGPAHEILTVASQAITHDAKGNITSIPAVLRSGSDSLAMSWDFDNRMTGADVDNDGTDDVTYQFDALGRRVHSDDGSTATVFVQSGQQTFADYTSGTAATSPTYTYVYASYIDEPVYRDGSGGVRYYHRTQQYSITALTDSSGTIRERYAYSAYGEPTITDAAGVTRTSTAEGNRYTYTGREWDNIAELFHYRARMYDSASGRFCSRDPIGYFDANSLYQSRMYLNALDSLGLCSVECTPFAKKDVAAVHFGMQSWDVGNNPGAGDDAVIDIWTIEIAQKILNIIAIRGAGSTKSIDDIIKEIVDAGGNPSSKNTVDAIEQIWSKRQKLGIRRQFQALFIKVRGKCCRQGKYPWSSNYWDKYDYWYRCDAAQKIDLTRPEDVAKKLDRNLQQCIKNAEAAFDCKTLMGNVAKG